MNDPYHPERLHTRAVKTPYGLAVQDTLLFVANGENGYSLYRTIGTGEPELIGQWNDYPVKDFIRQGIRLYMRGFHAVYIVNVDNPEEPEVVFTNQQGAGP